MESTIPTSRAVEEAGYLSRYMVDVERVSGERGEEVLK